MRRRDFIAMVSGAAAAWPLAARAQQPAMPVIGFLNSGRPEPYAHLVEAFRKGLGETGYIEGKTVAIEYRWAEDHYERLPALAADLVRRQVAVIAAAGGNAAALAAKAATATIPIVFYVGADPVALGLVPRLNRPGGNVTGINFFSNVLGTKRLQLLHEAVPKATAIGFLVNPSNPAAESDIREAAEAARALGLALNIVNASRDGDIDAAFAIIGKQQALLVGADPFLYSTRDRLVALAAVHRVPAIYTNRDYVASGGLMSYGTKFVEVYRQTGIYTGRILKGERPADMPVVQSITFELIVNLKTAKALGLSLSSGLLSIVDEVIE